MKHNQIRQVVFPILAALIWGTAFVAQDVCADTIGTFTFNAARYFIAVLALLVLIAVLHAVHKDRPQPTEAEKRAGRRQLWLGGFCCGTALAIASNFQQAGIAISDTPFFCMAIVSPVFSAGTIRQWNCTEAQSGRSPGRCTIADGSA